MTNAYSIDCTQNERRPTKIRIQQISSKLLLNVKCKCKKRLVSKVTSHCAGTEQVKKIIMRQEIGFYVF